MASAPVMAASAEAMPAPAAAPARKRRAVDSAKLAVKKTKVSLVDNTTRISQRFKVVHDGTLSTAVTGLRILKKTFDVKDKDSIWTALIGGPAVPLTKEELAALGDTKEGRFLALSQAILDGVEGDCLTTDTVLGDTYRFAVALFVLAFCAFPIGPSIVACQTAVEHLVDLEREDLDEDTLDLLTDELGSMYDQYSEAEDPEAFQKLIEEYLDPKTPKESLVTSLAELRSTLPELEFDFEAVFKAYEADDGEDEEEEEE